MFVDVVDVGKFTGVQLLVLNLMFWMRKCFLDIFCELLMLLRAIVQRGDDYLLLFYLEATTGLSG